MTPANSTTATDRWDLQLQSRTPSLGVDAVLATGTFAGGGAGMVELAAGTQVDADAAPVLSLALAKVGQPGSLLAATASVRFQSQTQEAPTTYTYDANGNTTAELAPSGTTTYAWDAENRLVR